MKWGLQHVRVTLKEESTGETIRIEQNSDGTVRCETAKRASKPKGEAERPAAKPTAERPAAERPAAKPSAPPPVRPAPANDAPNDPRRQRRTSTLEWKATRDAGYDGFLARSGNGQFKVLFNRVWALFFERRNEPPEPLGCYKNINKAKEDAQRLHDRGMRDSELTPDQVNAFCPPEAVINDSTPRSERRAQQEEATPKQEAEATPTPEPAERPAVDDASAEADALRALKSRVASMVTDNDDD